MQRIFQSLFLTVCLWAIAHLSSSPLSENTSQKADNWAEIPLNKLIGEQ
jgi:hypothetical protein